ncbi:MAG TPA: hypothetical protein VF715_06960 [Thermoleophilaceae bacterium]
MLHHSHAAHECETAFAAWAGFISPLRHEPVGSTCLRGGHSLYWMVRAADRAAALAMLPRFVADRTTAIEVREVEVP